MKNFYYILLTFSLTLLFSVTLYAQQSREAHHVGGVEADDIMDIAYDDEGNIYVTGIFRGTVDFDQYNLFGSGDERTSNGQSDIFIQKRSTTYWESPVAWTITIGGAGRDNVYAIAVSKGPDPKIYIGGQYENTVDFDPFGNAAQHPAVDKKDAFIAGYDADGNFEDFVYISGDGNENVTDLHWVEDDLVYIGGEFNQTASFNEGVTFVDSKGDYDMFIAKYKPSTSEFLWSHTIGGSGKEELTCLDADDAGRLYVGGGFYETVDFDPSMIGEHPVTSSGNQDAFVSCFDPAGSFQWVETLGNSKNNQTTALVIAGDTIWSASYFYDDISFITGYIGHIPILKTYSSNGGKDILLQKYLTDGTSVTSDWRHIGGSGTDQVNDMDYDSRNKLIITGFFGGINFDLNPDDTDEELFNSSGSYDIFIAKLNGSYEYIWGNTMGDSEMDISRALALKENDDIGVVGSFNLKVNFNPWGPWYYFQHSNGLSDGFIMNIKPYSDSCAILSFTIPEQTGPVNINDTLFIVNIEVHRGTDVTKLTPEITVSDKASIDPPGGVARDFSDTVVYTVTAEDSVTTRDWNVVVTLAPNTETDIIAFELIEQTGAASIDPANHKVDIEVENGTDLTSLTPTIEISDGAIINPASGENQDFSATVVYTVTAEDSVTTRDWNVVVTLAPNTETDIIAFELIEQTGAASIDPANHKVDIEVENGTDLTSLTPTIEISDGAIINPASGENQDFSATVVYTVTAEDATTQQEWSVVVSEAEATGIQNGDDAFISVYPNPANEKMYVRNPENKKVTIELHGINGKKYLQKIAEGSLTVVDIRGLPAGMYTLKVSTPDKTITRKWMITE
ncbi:MAG: T9SS type A sorting domain-containing protein [Bacteroidota bacterium]